MLRVNNGERTTERKQARTRIQHYNLIPNKDATGVRTWRERERERERLWNWRSEKETDLTEKVWLSSIWQCTGGEGIVCPPLGQTGTRRLSCACCYWVLSGKGKAERSLKCAWTFTCRTRTGRLCIGKDRPKNQVCFSLSCSFINGSRIPSSQVKPRPVECAFGLRVHFHLASIIDALIQPWGLAVWCDCLHQNRPTNAGSWGICCHWMNWEVTGWLLAITWPRSWWRWLLTWCCNVSLPPC